MAFGSLRGTFFGSVTLREYYLLFSSIWLRPHLALCRRLKKTSPCFSAYVDIYTPYRESPKLSPLSISPESIDRISHPDQERTSIKWRRVCLTRHQLDSSLYKSPVGAKNKTRPGTGTRKLPPKLQKTQIVQTDRTQAAKMPVPLGPESKKKDKSTVGPNGKSNMNDPLSTPNTTITMTATAETTTNVPPTASGRGPGVMTQEEVDRLYEERMEEEYAKREGGA
ncbi:uncharacterized protein ARB_03796 [Trichophyton benhamiae CBS 112371]|uniref:Uncharacterized protein n=1 Tax=Arthroderma benhamiae (strain ATCC MYA-4681 / CBS 112371) TaxID=663331 RepID=D4B5N7_ARTBC|nr:uncharacterized protein ARB_03796 [Trichophyton benhamiae CBS 112371]EFE29353.1 hypothetical protein ARB_03796 [Trichophyton benhamiae CBS 112371]